MGSRNPPFAVPSSFVITMPVIERASLKVFAWAMAFCPFVASTTSSVSWGAPSSSLPTTRLTFFISSMRFAFVWSLPAVSRIRTSMPRALAAFVASKATAAGSDPSACFTTSMCSLSAHAWSCSIAAALNVSQAPRRTFFPAAVYMLAIFAIVVVLPTPFTPMQRITKGLLPFVRAGASMPDSIFSISSLITFFTSSEVFTCPLFHLSFNEDMSSSAVSTPASERMTASSISSKTLSSMGFPDMTHSIWVTSWSLVFARPFFIFSKIPIGCLSDEADHRDSGVYGFPHTLQNPFSSITPMHEPSLQRILSEKSSCS